MEKALTDVKGQMSDIRNSLALFTSKFDDLFCSPTSPQSSSSSTAAYMDQVGAKETDRYQRKPLKPYL